MSERTVRVAASAGAFVVLVALVGLGTIIAQMGRVGRSVETVSIVGAGPPSPEVAALRARADGLREVLDTIRREEGRLRAAAGIPTTDTTTLLRRFFPRLPSILGGSRRTRPGAGPGQAAARPDTADSGAVRSAAELVHGSADSLATLASGTLQRFRRLTSSASVGRDTIRTLSLLPESLAVAVRTGAPGLAHLGAAIEWTPVGSAAVALGMEAEVVAMSQEQPGVWSIELRGPGGLLGRLRAPGRPLVRSGERVVRGQLVVLVDGVGPGGPVRFEVRRNGLLLDPTTLRAARGR